MNKKLKNIILFAIFIIILFISTFSSQFGSDKLWSNSNGNDGEFSGLLFKNPVEISNLVVSRNIVKDGSEDLIRYDVEFDFTGAESSLRILGTPVRQVFFENGVIPSHSVVKLKGDYDKINDQLFNEKLKHADLYRKANNYEFKAVSEIRVPLSKEVGRYSFSVYYNPRDLVYEGKEVVTETSVFITNARVDKFVNTQKAVEAENPYFNQSGFYVNTQEILNKSAISKISLISNIGSILFVVSVVGTLVLIWLDNKRLRALYDLFLLLILLTFYGFLGYGVSTVAILLFYPILAYIATCIGRAMSNDSLMLSKKDLKQNLGYTIIFFIFTLVILIIPRAL